MAKIDLFYSSTTDNMEIVAGLIKDAVNKFKADVVTVFNVAESSVVPAHLGEGGETWIKISTHT